MDDQFRRAQLFTDFKSPTNRSRGHSSEGTFFFSAASLLKQSSVCKKIIMRGILKTKTVPCDPHDWRIHADVDVSLQYAKANSYKNTRIVCMGSHAYPPKYTPSRQLGNSRLIRFADEDPSTDVLSKPRSAKVTVTAECKKSESVLEGPKLACRFSKESKGRESLIAASDFGESRNMKHESSSNSFDDSFLTSATDLLSRWKEAMSSNELFALLAPSRLNSNEHN